MAVNKEIRAAAYAWFDRADELWSTLGGAKSDEEFRRIAQEHAEATMTGLSLLEKCVQNGTPNEPVVVGLA